MLPAQARTTTEAKTIKQMPLKEAIGVNNLEYPMTRPLSLVTQARHVEHCAQTSNYPAGSAITIFTASGDDFINGKASWFRFGFTATGAVGDFGAFGSAVNCIESISLYHSSGTLIDRVDGVHLKHAVDSLHMKDAAWFATNAKAYGHGEVALVAGTTYTFVVPLGDLHGFWNTDKLIPGFLHSGMKVVIQTNSNAAINGTTGAAISITDPTLVLHSITLTDSALLHLQEVSAKQGLIFPFNSYEHISIAPGVTTSLDLSIFRAVSQATDAMIVGRLANVVNVITADEITLDAFSAADYTTGGFQHQFKIAGQYYPLRALSTTADHFTWNRNAVTLDTSKGCAFLPTSAENLGVVRVRLERDYMLKSQGIPVSGSRSLNYKGVVSSADRRIDFYMTFVKLAHCYLYDRVMMEE